VRTVLCCAVYQLCAVISIPMCPVLTGVLGCVPSAFYAIFLTQGWFVTFAAAKLASKGIVTLGVTLCVCLPH